MKTSGKRPKYGPTEWNQGDWRAKLRIAAWVAAVAGAIILFYVLALLFTEPGTGPGS